MATLDRVVMVRQTIIALIVAATTAFTSGSDTLARIESTAPVRSEVQETTTTEERSRMKQSEIEIIRQCNDKLAELERNICNNASLEDLVRLIEDTKAKLQANPSLMKNNQHDDSGISRSVFATEYRQRVLETIGIIAPIVSENDPRYIINAASFLYAEISRMRNIVKGSKILPADDSSIVAFNENSYRMERNLNLLEAQILYLGDHTVFDVVGIDTIEDMINLLDAHRNAITVYFERLEFPTQK